MRFSVTLQKWLPVSVQLLLSCIITSVSTFDNSWRPFCSTAMFNDIFCTFVCKSSEWNGVHYQVSAAPCYRHSGKARRGDGNDVTPNPSKLYATGRELRKLARLIYAMSAPGEMSAALRARTLREKNKYASRICRLKKKAQHEANKIKLHGLEQEHCMYCVLWTFVACSYVKVALYCQIMSFQRHVMHVTRSSMSVSLLYQVLHYLTTMSIFFSIYSESRKK